MDDGKHQQRDQQRLPSHEGSGLKFDSVESLQAYLESPLA